MNRTSGIALLAAGLTVLAAPPASAQDLGSPASRAAVLGELFGAPAAQAAASMTTGSPSRPTPSTAATDPDSSSAPAPAAAPARLVSGDPVMASDLAARSALAQAQSAPADSPQAAQALGLQQPTVPAGSTAATLPAEVGPVINGTVCPVAGPHTLSDTWGQSRGGGRHHLGTDMAAATGTPVVAMAAGVIDHVDPAQAQSPLGGITVSYTTAGGERWYMAHLSSLAATSVHGAFVQMGQVLGYVGSTGNSTGPHLHVGLNLGDGPRTNPYSTLRTVCR